MAFSSNGHQLDSSSTSSIAALLSYDRHDAPRRHQPFVPDNMKMKEFTLRAVLLGLIMSVILGAANAYLGLRAGQTIAATYPAAVISMAVLRLAQRHDPRREHRADGRLDRRIGRGGRDLHDPGVLIC